MKHLLFLFISIITVVNCNAQSKINLQKLDFTQDTHVILKGRTREAEDPEAMTSLPAYRTSDIAGFSYGPVTFTNGNDSQLGLDGSVELILNSVKEKKIVGVFIEIEKTSEAKKLIEYISRSFAKPAVLTKPPKPNPHGLRDGRESYIYRDIQPGLTLLESIKNTITNNKQNTAVTLYILKDDAALPPPFNESLKRVIDRVIKSLTY